MRVLVCLTTFGVLTIGVTYPKVFRKGGDTSPAFNKVGVDYVGSFLIKYGHAHKLTIVKS